VSGIVFSISSIAYCLYIVELLILCTVFLSCCFFQNDFGIITSVHLHMDNLSSCFLFEYLVFFVVVVV
jgi:hypothetical protein